jgi:hypothetical protein
MGLGRATHVEKWNEQIAFVVAGLGRDALSVGVELRIGP